MAFLDNSGDIILDAVLTDAGRARLARGDGSFKIAKFAFGDDEIDYSSYNAAHASGSAYFDLEVLQTPVFEAFTNNTSTMKSKLLSLTNNNLLYLPILKLNDTATSQYAPTESTSVYGSGSHVVLVDTDTITAVKTAQNGIPTGVIRGVVGSSENNHIRIDQGLDTTEISPALMLDPELKETQYIVELDSRFGKLYDVSNAAPAGSTAAPSFIDDDLIASYYFTQNVGSYVQNSKPGDVELESGQDAEDNNETISGPRGTNLRFGILAATDLITSDYLFTTIGNTLPARPGDTAAYYYIDATVRVTGVTTGYKIDIPIRFLKKQ